MKINKLNIFSFGKFQNKNIELEDGINLIVGNNESGKTTITSFIEGIFYGFSKNSLKRRLYFDEYEKYKPWNSEKYRGSIDLEFKGDKFRVERDFKEDKLSVLNLSKHQDLSEDNRNFTYSRVAQPGLLFFGMSSDVYKSTFLIRQLKTRFSYESANFVRDRIENFVLTNDKDIDGKKAIDILNEELDKLGKKTRSKSEIGSLAEKIDNIDKKLLELEGINKKLAISRNKIKDIDEQIANAENKQEFYRKIKEQEDYNKLVEIDAKISDIKSKLKEIKPIDSDNFQRAVELEKNFISLKQDYDDLLSQKKENLDKTCEEEIEEINKDKEEVRNIISRLNDLNSINYSRESEILYGELGQVKNKGILYIIAIVISSLLIFFCLYFAISRRIRPLFFALPFLLIYIFLRLRKLRVEKDLSKRLSDRISSYRKKSFDKLRQKKQMDVILEELYKKYEADDIISLQAKIEKLSDQKNEAAYIYKIERKRREEIDQKLEQIKNALANIKKELDNIYKENSVKDFDEIRSNFKSNDNYSNYLVKIKVLENEYKNILKDRDISELDHKIDLENYDKEIYKQDISSLKIEKVKLEEKLKYNDSKFKDYINLIEERSNLQKKLKEKQDNKKAIEKAIKIISELLEENREDLFPKIVEKMNYYISNITSNKYSKLTIDKDFNIKVYDSNSSTFVALDNLSHGTIDQIYLSLRLSIIDILGQTDPIILDDHFLQYDDARLTDTLKFLANLENQIIIFSATTREKKVLNEQGIKYNLIEMGNL